MLTLYMYIHSQSSLARSKKIQSFQFNFPLFPGSLLYYDPSSLLIVENKKVFFWGGGVNSVALYFVCNRLDLMRCHPCLCCFENTCKIWPLPYLVPSSLNYLADVNYVILGHHCYTYMQSVFAEILKRDYKGKSFLKIYICFCLKR